MNLDQPTFDALALEWHGIETGRVSVWEDSLRRLAREQTQLMADRRWVAGPDDMLTILGRQRRETYHCAILAWLFDPVAPHGLGPLLLGQVLQTLFPQTAWSDQKLWKASVSTEITRSGTFDGRRIKRRADLIVRAADLYLVVEAKVDHREAEEQCNDLHKLFRHEDGARFVFLTPRGSPPPNATGPAKRAFRLLGFTHIRALLKNVEPTGAPGWGTVDTYRRTLAKEFPG